MQITNRYFLLNLGIALVEKTDMGNKKKKKEVQRHFKSKRINKLWHHNILKAKRVCVMIND